MAAQPSPSAAAEQQPAAAATDQSQPQAAPTPAAATAEQPAQAPAAEVSTQPATQAAAAEQAAAPQVLAPPTPLLDSVKPGPLTEEDLRRVLVGKTFYLRGGYLDNNLAFGETGQFIGQSPKGSYTLAGIEIDKVHLSKHKVELDGTRFGLHFLGALPYEDPTKAVDRVKITPKKKFVKITIDRELIVTPKKKKAKEQAKDSKASTTPGETSSPAEPPASAPAEANAAGTDPSDTDKTAAGQSAAEAGAKPAAPADSPASASTDAQSASAAGAQQSGSATEQSDEDQAKAEMAAAPKEEQPADPKSITTTTSPAHAAKIFWDALDKIFATGLDDRMMAAMPDFWKLYYKAAAAGTDYRPSDPAVMRQGAVDQKAKLLSRFVPESNDFAQDAGVAGMALYHTVVGADGKPGEIAVARPIGFGLDENAVAAIRKANFQPAMKDGKPVPVLLDLEIVFRIYSKRTNVASKPDDANQAKDQKLPGPYTLQAERLSRAQAADAQSQPVQQTQNQ
jgi:TonB family protein